jgi:23S rRNA pseudouridine1911/1915/1917 synthase
MARALPGRAAHGKSRYRRAVSETKTLRLRVPADAAGLRLDQALARLATDLSRGQARRLIARGSVFVAGSRVKVAGRAVRAGQTLEIHQGPDETATATPRPVPEIPILLTTPDFVVVDKPSGVLSAPTPETDQADLLHFLRPTLGELYLVHRLDAPTSGVLLLARTALAARSLSAQLETRTLSRTYAALLLGSIAEDCTCETPVGGKTARTRFRTIEHATEATRVEAELDTGRTHQIRIHAQTMGHPVLGDRKYGGPLPRDMPRPPRLALHALAVRFTDPRTGADTEVQAPFPSELWAYWSSLRAAPSETTPSTG